MWILFKICACLFFINLMHWQGSVRSKCSARSSSWTSIRPEHYGIWFNRNASCSTWNWSLYSTCKQRIIRVKRSWTGAIISSRLYRPLKVPLGDAAREIILPRLLGLNYLHINKNSAHWQRFFSSIKLYSLEHLFAHFILLYLLFHCVNLIKTFILSQLMFFWN